MGKLIKRNAALLILFAIASFVMVYSNINTTRAQLKYESLLYTGEVSVDNIGIALMEKSDKDTDYIMVAERRNAKTADDNTWVGNVEGVLLNNLLRKNEEHEEIEGIQPGHTYSEHIAVKNTGSIPQYCRVIIRRYWEKFVPAENDSEHGEWKKCNSIASDMIDLHFVNTDVWIKDEAWPNTENPETTVLYHKGILGSGIQSEDITDTLTVNGFVSDKVTTTTTEDDITKIKYYYDGYRFCIEVEADAVQTHNPSDAMISAWGFDATFMTGSEEG